MSHNNEVGEMLQTIQKHFAAINADENLTAEDKGQLKEFYLEHLMAPKAQKLLQKHFPQDFPAAESLDTHPIPKNGEEKVHDRVKLIIRFATPKQIPRPLPCGLFFF